MTTWHGLNYTVWLFDDAIICLCGMRFPSMDEIVFHFEGTNVDA